MKQIVLLLVIIQTAVFSVTAANDKKLVMKTSDGATACAIRDIKCITFENGVMLVGMKNGSVASWNTDWLESVVFSAGEETGIATVVQPAAFTVKDNVLFINCSVPAAVQLCACDGKVLLDGVCNGNFSFDMRPLPSGMYLLKIDGCTHKILNR